MVAVGKNPSLRTPSYVLLAGLAFTDFCTGLLSQLLFAVYQIGELTRKREVFYIAGVIADYTITEILRAL